MHVKMKNFHLSYPQYYCVFCYSILLALSQEYDVYIKNVLCNMNSFFNKISQKKTSNVLNVKPIVNMKFRANYS